MAHDSPILAAEEEGEDLILGQVGVHLVVDQTTGVSLHLQGGDGSDIHDGGPARAVSADAHRCVGGEYGDKGPGNGATRLVCNPDAHGADQASISYCLGSQWPGV